MPKPEFTHVMLVTAITQYHTQTLMSTNETMTVKIQGRININ